MSRLVEGVKTYWSDVAAAWDRFWFTPTDPATLSAIRLFTGAMLFYTHLVWSFDLSAFFGPDGWLPIELYRIDQGYDNAEGVPGMFRVSIFPWIHATWLLWTVHIVALVTFFLFMVGLFTRTTAILSAIFAISYMARVTPGAFFGLDKVNCMLALYLMLGPCGARYSLDRLWRMRRGGEGIVESSVMANVAIRLIQLHLCCIYFYSGLGKLEGETWWTGEAIWQSIANLEYQTLDVTFLGNYPWLLSILALTTVFWELFYLFLIWPRFTRPWMLAIAVGVHGFIGLCLGMITFALIMLIANASFLSPATVRRLMDPIAGRVSLAIVGERVE